METLAYWVVRPGTGELRAEHVSDRPAPGRSLVRAERTGVSAGTERLVGLGLVPESCRERMALRTMGGSFELPVKYGYSFVGTGIAGALEGRRVFAMHPHQAVAEIDDADAVVLPDAIPSSRATLLPNLETALNAVWDAELEPGDACAVVGGGAVGLLVAFVLRRQGLDATIVERDPSRRLEATPFAGAVVGPRQLESGRFRVAFHCSGKGEGLAAALDAVGFEGRVIELSWYGSRPVGVDLGASFHYDRKRIIASQVATVARSHRGPDAKVRRMREVLSLLEDEQLDDLLVEPIPFRRMPAFMDILYHEGPVPAAPLISYDAAETVPSAGNA